MAICLPADEVARIVAVRELAAALEEFRAVDSERLPGYDPQGLAQDDRDQRLSEAAARVVAAQRAVVSAEI